MKKIFIFLLIIQIGSLLFANELYDKLDVDNYSNTESRWIQKHSLDILKTKNRETVKTYYPLIESMGFYHEAEDRFVKWYELKCYSNLFIKRNVRNGYDCLVIGSDTDTTSLALAFGIDEVELIEDNIWKLTVFDMLNTGVLKNTHYFYRWPIQEEECVIYIKFDGDYANLYINSLTNYYNTFCKVTTDTLHEYEYLIKNNRCDLSVVTWPCHADGSCDYESSVTNVAPGKVMTAYENLKLRSGEATSSNVITVMAAGTKVKILELGKAETIDGIKSNWVKVEIQAGAKDRDGRAIKAGTVGWCYGGYLE